MREILFKAKRIDNGEWVQGYYYQLWEKGYILWGMVNDHPDMIEVYPETLCQYTGLTDKNGNKIWENDILKFNDEVWESCYTSCGTEYDSWEVENYGLVGFFEEELRFDFLKYKFNENSVEADLHDNNNIEFAEFARENEVVGNTFDNPELLEV